MHRLVTRGSGSKRLELSPSERMSESGRLSSFDALTRTINRSHDVFQKRSDAAEPTKILAYENAPVLTGVEPCTKGFWY